MPLLANHFLAVFASRGRPRATLTPAAHGGLAAHAWPGNVRELENTLERLAVTARGGTIDAADLPAALRGAAAPPIEEALFAGLPTLDEMEKRYLRHVLAAVRRQPQPGRGGPRHRPPHALPDGRALRAGPRGRRR